MLSKSVKTGAGKTGVDRCSLGRAELLGEKRHFAAATPTVIPDHAALTNHSVAGNNHGNRIVPHSGSHGTGGTGAANTLSHRPITLYGTLRNIQKRTPHLHLKRRTLQMQGDALPASTENTQRLLVKRMLALMQLRVRVFGAQVRKSRIGLSAKAI